MQGAIQPAVFGGFDAGRAGLHEVLRIEVRAARIGRAGGVHDGQMALVPERLQGRHRGMQSEEAVEIDDRVARNIDRRPHGVVSLLAVRNHDVQSVGRAALEDDHQPLVCRCRVRRAE